MASDITHLPNAAERAALPADGGADFNRLIHSTSPYLLQHAQNPVEWYEWGSEAFAKAIAEDKPIFLSVGYSTCHWCHVMAHESFEDHAIADVLNRSFVCIKVDREERPDVDGVYMAFVQATTGRGGWPMSVYMTPERKPFYGGTYFPTAGFMKLNQGIANAWIERRNELLASAERLTGELRRMSQGQGGSTDTDLNGPPLERAMMALVRQCDEEFGGFGDAPKFPRPVLPDLALLLGVSDLPPQQRTHSQQMAVAALRAMANGGMYDHLGGGFHRYSVDQWWHVPHFEKMLYDQGQLVVSYIEGWRLTGDEAFAEVARQTCQYVLRDLCHPKGGLYSAEDADSLSPDGSGEHAEGAFYVWTAAELSELLGDDYPIFSARYGVSESGNVRSESDPMGELQGTNVLYAAQSVVESAQACEVDTHEAMAALERAHNCLIKRRQQRPRPHLDDKIIAAWNGLMITGLARAGHALDEPVFVAAAERAADFIRGELWDADQKVLYRTWREGRRSDIAGFSSDYAYLIQGLIELFSATQDLTWLSWAEELQVVLDEHFTNDQTGGWFDSATAADLLIRTQEQYDGAEPAPTSVSIVNGMRLAQFTGREEYRERAERALIGLADSLRINPHVAPLALNGWLRLQCGEQSVVIVGDEAGPETQALRAVVRAAHAPCIELLVLNDHNRSALTADRPWLAAMLAQNERPTAYVCAGHVCQQPVHSPAALREQLNQLN